MYGKNSKEVGDYYGYCQLYPNNIRKRRWFQQFQAIEKGGPFCIKTIVKLVIVYDVLYYSYQFMMKEREHRHDLEHVKWLKTNLS